MVPSTTRITSYYYRFTNAASIAPWMCFQRHLMFYTCNYNIRVTHRNGANKHILHESDPRRDYQQIVSIHFLSLHALALHLAVKILLQIFLYEDLSTLALHTSVGCISPGMPAGPHFVTQPILLSENIPNIWHKSSTNTRRSDQIETIKTIMQTTRPRITWKVLPMAQAAIFKEIFDCEKDLDRELFYSELKRHNVSHYIYYLATDNIHIVLENDNTVLIKGLLKGCKC